MSDQRYSDEDVSRRDIPSFIEPPPPIIDHPFKRPRPQKGMNLLELFEEDSEIEEPELVQVYLRLKPSKVHSTLYEVRSDTCLVTSLDTATAGHGRRTQHNVSKMYNFTKIFEPHCDQKEIFEQVVKNNLKKLPEGHNFTLLTYGASGSGKTYTVMGTVGSPGLVPRSLEYVFKLVDAAQQPLYKPAENGAVKLNSQTQNNELQWMKRLGQVSAPHRDKYRRMSVRLHNDLTASSTDLSNKVQYYVWVSFIEIYNEAVYDLLAPPEKRTKLRIREDSSGNVFVKGATQVFVRSGEEAYNVMAAGKHNLVVAATGVHAQSSRSHCIFTISMLTETAGSVRTSCVRLCDLAGCERARATRNTGTRMQESRAINSSLHVLERCLHMLRKNQRSRNDAIVPYRESKLTRLLGSGLSGAKGEAISMVVTLNTSPEYAHETRHVLGLASVAQDIQISNTMLESRFEATSTTYAQETTVNDCSTDILMLRAENERLQFELYQSQARCKELLTTIAEMQRAKASEMYEVMEEAKDLTQQYYETEIKILKSRMQDMTEEFESRISEFEDKLTVERYARNRAEEKLQHNTCINCKKDETYKTTKLPEDVMVLSDSEHSDDESDPLNESLEPTFKNINQNDSFNLRTMDNIEEENNLSDNENSTTNYCFFHSDISDNSKQIKSTNPSADKMETSEDDVYDETDTTSEIVVGDSKVDIKYDDGSEMEESRNATDDNDDDSNDKEINNSNIINDNEENNKKSTEQNMSRGTYFVRTSAIDVLQNSQNDFHIDNKQIDDSIEKSVNLPRSTYFISDTASVTTENINNRDDAKELVNDYMIAEPCHKNIKFNNIYPQSEKIKNLLRGTYFASSDESCDGKEINDKGKDDFQDPNATAAGVNKKINRTIDDNSVNNDLSTDVSQTIENKFKDEIKEIFKEPFRIKSVKLLTVDKEISINSGTSTFLDKAPVLVSLSVENTENGVTKKADYKPSKDIEVNTEGSDSNPIQAVYKHIFNKTKATIAGTSNQPNIKVSKNPATKLIMSSKFSHDSDSSLRQFEQLEKAMRDLDNEEANNSSMPNNESVFQTMNLLKHEKSNIINKIQKITEESNPDPEINKEKRVYFDNIDAGLDETSDKKVEKNNDEKRLFSSVKDKVESSEVVRVELNKTTKEYEAYRNFDKEKHIYFNNIDADSRTNKSNKNESIEKQNSDSAAEENIKLTKITNLLRESFTKPEIITSVKKTRLAKQQESVDLFESPIVVMAKETDIEKATNSIEQLALNPVNNFASDLQLTPSIKKEFDQLKQNNNISEIICNTKLPVKEIYDISVKSEITSSLDQNEDKKCITKIEPISFDNSLIKKISNINDIKETIATESKKEIKVEQISLESKTIKDEIKKEVVSIEQPNQDAHESQSALNDNTIEEFEKIYKDISAHRTTEFDLLVTQSINDTSAKTDKEEIKYNLRKKPNSSKVDDVVLASSVAIENKNRTRSLRLRRQKKLEDEVDKLDDKLRDIGNLQTEFSDVTMGIPATQKVVEDIPSPEKGVEENIHPIYGIQSCPSKSITRSRRKLFTPRAEPLEESLNQTENSNERVCVPRPSYHRPRARRKL